MAQLAMRALHGMSRLFFVLLLAAALIPGSAFALSSLYTVSGVAVDVSDKDANTAKLKAISEAQVKAFYQLAQRLGGDQAVKRLQGLNAAQIGRMMASLSVQEERTGPGRYIGKLSITFLPGQIRNLMGKYGISYTEQIAPKIVILPIWKGADGPVAWEDNPWRRAWQQSGAESGLVPIIVPLGDTDDTQAISAQEAAEGNTVKLETLKLRYEAEALLVAVAEPAGDNAIHAVMSGDSPLGRVIFDKIYTADGGDIHAAAALAAKRFISVMNDKWKAAHLQPPRSNVQSMSVSVPFGSAAQWSGIRSRILATPGVTGVDVMTLSGKGALVKLNYATGFGNLQSALASSGLRLVQSGGGWLLQPL